MLSRLRWTGSAWEKHDLVRGLPRSEENHSGNGIVVDENTGIAYVAYGGNTNMGAPSHNFDDEERLGVVDANDPFGGNKGKNQAVIQAGLPVQVYAPGFRNPYDLAIP